ncbi:hypothetical protein SMICM304S_07284 [Streptomyces microflavus]
MVEASGEDDRVRVTGAEARRVKREVLGVPDRIKHQRRVAVPMQRRAPEAGNRRRAYRYRCYPSPSQAEQLIKTFGACRWTYNEGLALRDKAWREHRVSIGFAESCRALTGWRNAEGTRWLQEVSSTVLQQALRHLDAAFGQFFNGTTKHPRRKKKSRSHDSATYVRTGFRWVEDPEQPGTGLIALAKQSGPLRIRWSRPLPAGTRPVKLTVSRGGALKDGLLQQVDSPRNMYDRPANLFVAGFIGSPAMNLVEVPITDGGVKFGNSVVPVSREALTAAADRGDTTVTVGIRPEHFDIVEHGGAAAKSLSKDSSDEPAGLAVSVNVVEELGADGFVYGAAQVAGKHQDLVVRVGGRSVPEKGTELHVVPRPDELHVFATSTGELSPTDAVT